MSDPNHFDVINHRSARTEQNGSQPDAVMTSYPSTLESTSLPQAASMLSKTSSSEAHQASNTYGSVSGTTTDLTKTSSPPLREKTALVNVQSNHVGHVEAQDDSNVGVEDNNLHWFKAAMIMIAETISLGVLGLPRCLAALGIIPGVILIWSFGLMATYTGFVVWQFKQAHPDMRTLAHGLEMIFGRWGRWVGEVSQSLMLLFVMAAHVVLFGSAMAELTNRGICKVLSMAIGAFTCFIVSLPRTMKGNSYHSALSCCSITIATTIALISIARTNPVASSHFGPAYAILPYNLTSFKSAAMASSSIILAFNGHIAYPTIITEMIRPQDFPKALIFLESVAVTFYTIVAVVMYIYAGQGVTAPALGSAEPLVRKVAYGFALPTIVVAGVIMAVVLGKNLYSFTWRRRLHVTTENTFRAWGSWIGILVCLWVLAWIVANVIPIFGQLLGLIGALFGTWFALGFCSMLWLGLNVGRHLEKWKKVVLTAVNVGILLVCAGCCIVGTYGSLMEIIAGGEGGKPFSCNH
ncbi:hypothetical protein LTR78_008240 [Recurvomyces mirabilis]|uniref:Amino acid transporter transmembrane domain-containing protein n=1 Tax=Recurvomyces mirabilis TaxID=574656 RepID=A0AAE0TQH4_9PEZI|nr:hypothetical protein LTR78_008240 [Recurvomyces mirabilis]KAK5156525.1 hypothetical protein LTS14_004737 [Recurvomyces mirabilis]